MCMPCRRARASRRIVTVLRREATVFLRDGGQEDSTRTTAGMEKAMRAFCTYRQFPRRQLGDPVQWLPPRVIDNIKQGEAQRLKDICSDPQRMAKAKVVANVSDKKFLTVLKVALPPQWHPKRKHLLQARKETTEHMQVRQWHCLTAMTTD